MTVNRIKPAVGSYNSQEFRGQYVQFVEVEHRLDRGGRLPGILGLEVKLDKRLQIGYE